MPCLHEVKISHSVICIFASSENALRDQSTGRGGRQAFAVQAVQRREAHEEQVVY